MKSPPFAKAFELKDWSLIDGDPSNFLFPQKTRTFLEQKDLNALQEYIYKDLYAFDLEGIAQSLWIMSTQSSSNIGPLHHQRVKGREIVITEDPRLHLVWIHDRIFIKPLPQYLLSHDFWQTFIFGCPSKLGERGKQMQLAALGFLRTYRHLIRHESDLRIAQRDELQLVPKDVDWPKVHKFLSQIESVMDSDVSERYHYGEIRLSRLNFYAPFLIGKLRYEQVSGQYSDIFGRLYAPTLFIFAFVTTVLNSLQVEMAVEQVSEKKWQVMTLLSRWFGVIALIFTCTLSLGFCGFWMWLFADEWIYALRCRRKIKKSQTKEMHRLG